MVLNKPLHRVLNSLREWCELEVGKIVTQLLVGGRLLQLPICLGGVKVDLTLEVESLHNGIDCIANSHFVFLPNRDDDRVYLLKVCFGICSN